MLVHTQMIAMTYVILNVGTAGTSLGYETNRRGGGAVRAKISMIGMFVDTESKKNAPTFDYSFPAGKNVICELHTIVKHILSL